MKLSCVCLTFTLVSILTMAMGVIIFGQMEKLAHLALEIRAAEQNIRAKEYDTKEKLFVLQLREANVNVVKENVEKAQRIVEELSANNQKLETENQECQQTQKDLATALEQDQQEKTTLEGDFITLVSQWQEEINKLKQALNVPSPVCAFVMKNADTEKLCSEQQHSPQKGAA